MNFNKHSQLQGQHAYLGASKYHWINYSDDKLIDSYRRHSAVKRGTELHEYAAQSIRLGIKQQRSKMTLNMYINDAIGFRMIPEQVLYYSDNCYGTADTINFDSKRKILRIHDYKSGEIPANMNQLLVYTALFCLEYKIKPSEIETILRIYQFDDYVECRPTAEDILPIMDKIVTFDKLIDKIRAEEE